MLDQLVADMLLYVSALELRPGTLTEPEIEKLLTTAGKSRNPVRDRLLLLLAYRHALRVSELVDLRADQFDLEAAQVHIKRAKNGILSIHGLQSDEVRLIRQLIRENGEHSRFLFLSERGAPLSIDGATRSAGTERMDRHRAYHGAVGKAVAQFIDSAAAAEFCSSRQVPSKDELQRLARDAGFCDVEVRVSLPVPAVPPVTKLILLERKILGRGGRVILLALSALTLSGPPTP